MKNTTVYYGGGGGGVNKIFGYYVVFEWSLMNMKCFFDGNFRYSTAFDKQMLAKNLYSDFCINFFVQVPQVLK